MPRTSKIAFSSDSRYLFTISEHGHMSTWDAITGDRLWQDQVESTTPFDFSSIQGSLCLVAAGTQIRVRDALDRSWNGALLAHEKHVLTCSFGPDGQLVLSSSVDGLVRLWSRQTGKQLVATPKLSSLAQVMTFWPDGTKFVTAGDDGSVRIWRTADAEPTTGILSHGSNVTGVVFKVLMAAIWLRTSGDARSPYQGGEPIIRFWDASNGRPIRSQAIRRLSARLRRPTDGPVDPWRLAVVFFAADGHTLQSLTVGGILASLDVREMTTPVKTFSMT